ncbi:acetate kinase [Nakamurella panacisegetis]|uniref:Acetate kinase n=1 Tax=Nakamurella panacisegetis TaxID=1090615 RepID=A0A1H0MNH1_9ACTN|nr:acetate kinase [Nakamurella panacisegetis]SDO81927.1 acetate kinase [Nakamurella panacisegetis]
MTEGTHRVLVMNSGSSSMKYQLIDVVDGTAVAGGLIERIGQAVGHASHRFAGNETSFDGPIPDHATAVRIMQQLFVDSGRPLQTGAMTAVGHRVVHGGSLFGDPVLIDDEVLRQIRDLSALAPLHNPANATGIEQAMAAFPGVPQVAVFDTAFFRTLPAAAYTYAIDRETAAAQQIRRYGFHGTSHQYVSGRVATVLGRPLEDFNQIVLHLGNGASASAIRGGVAVETSMGLTPLEGLVMGTRSGDLDPGAILHLLRTGGLDVDGLDALLNRRSGLLGLSGVSDFRDLADLVAAGDADATVALDVYCHRIRKYIGAYLAVLGGVDVITFTAGVGENAADVRARIMTGLEGLGISVDPARNAVRSSEPRIISPDGAPVTVMVIPTDEELAIARAAAELVSLVAGTAVSAHPARPGRATVGRRTAPTPRSSS